MWMTCRLASVSEEQCVNAIESSCQWHRTVSSKFWTTHLELCGFLSGPTCVFASRGYDSMRHGQLSVRPCLLQNELLQFARTQIKIRQFVLVLSRLTRRFWGSHLCPVNLATFAHQTLSPVLGALKSLQRILDQNICPNVIQAARRKKPTRGRLPKTSGGQRIWIHLTSILFDTHICWIHMNSWDLWVLYQMYNMTQRVFVWL